MDLLKKYDLPILSPLDILETLQDCAIQGVTVGLLNGKDRVFVLEACKTLESLTDQFALTLVQLSRITLANFLRLRYLYVKETSIFLIFDGTKMSLASYLTGKELSIETKFHIFKQVVEIVYNLQNFNEDFSEFDLNNFFLVEQEPNLSKSPVLVKIIYHGKIN